MGLYLNGQVAETTKANDTDAVCWLHIVRIEHVEDSCARTLQGKIY